MKKKPYDFSDLIDVEATKADAFDRAREAGPTIALVRASDGSSRVAQWNANDGFTDCDGLPVEVVDVRRLATESESSAFHEQRIDANDMRGMTLPCEIADAAQNLKNVDVGPMDQPEYAAVVTAAKAKLDGLLERLEKMTRRSALRRVKP